jgi:hypothetical protein
LFPVSQGVAAESRAKPQGRIIAGHALVQNARRGHYELAVEEPANRRVAVASTNWPWRF